MATEVIIERINALIESLKTEIEEDNKTGKSPMFFKGEILGLETAIKMIEQEQMFENLFAQQKGINNEQIVNNKKQMSL